jgi:hypothetical protein
MNYYNIKPINPRKPIDRLLKSLEKKTIKEHIKDKTCSSCYKYTQILKMTGNHIREWGISGMCSSCQDNFFLEN